MQKVLFVLVVLLVANLDARCQYYSVYSHYHLNPFLYNPAEAGTSRATFSANYRQQWMGFTGAPKITTVTFTSLIDDSRTGIGIKASTYSRGILKTTDFSFSYAYAVPVGLNSNLFFGLSGGAISNTIDISNVDMSDPAVARYLEKNIQPVANFGVLYKSENGINLGLMLPQLFTPSFDYTATNFENTTPSVTDEIIGTFYYKKKLDKKALRRRHSKFKNEDEYAPLELYALYKYSSWGGDQFEVTARINCSQSVWLAGGYRQNYGPMASMGFRLSDKISVSYAYEPGANMQENYSPDSHEINLTLRTGDVKKIRKKAPPLQSTFKGPHSGEHTARFQQHTEEEVTGIAEKEFYVVIKSFRDFDSADVYKKKLISQKFNAEVYFYEKQSLFYVFVFQSTKSSDAHKEARNLRAYTKLKEARVLIVDKK
jgi:type IX secretion system PorP/SprF family membrane protein